MLQKFGLQHRRLCLHHGLVHEMPLPLIQALSISPVSKHLESGTFGRDVPAGHCEELKFWGYP